MTSIRSGEPDQSEREEAAESGNVAAELEQRKKMRMKACDAPDCSMRRNTNSYDQIITLPKYLGREERRREYFAAILQLPFSDGTSGCNTRHRMYSS